MLIRSQNKKAFANMNTMRALYATMRGKGKYEIVCDPCGDIGTYSTEQKAIKVLDMIQGCYESSLYCNHAFDDSAKVQRPYIFAENRVFQMPSDEEVEV